MAKHLIIATVGTSIFTNFNKKEVREAFDNARQDRIYDGGVNLDDLEDDDAGAYDEDCFSTREQKIQDYWLRGCFKENGKWKYAKDTPPNLQASAEITSILEIAEKIREDDNNAEIEVQLVSTDTALSVSAAKLIQGFFKGSDKVSAREFDKAKDFVASLGVKPKSDDTAEVYYDTGLQNLVDKLMGEDGIIKKAKAADIKPVINFSGGYKSTVPVLTIIAQLEGIPMYYIYEDSDHLMEVGNLPFSLDWGVMEYFHPFLDNALIENTLQFDTNGLNDKILSLLVANKLIVGKGDGYEISPIGSVFITYFRSQSSSKPSIFGEYIEKKLFQFYTEKFRTNTTLPSEEGKLIEIPQHGVSYAVGKDNGDFDLVLEKELEIEAKKVKYSIACEVKSVSNVRDKEEDKEKLKNQFRKYANCFSVTFNGRVLSEIRLIIHLLPYQEQYISAELLKEFSDYVEKDLNLKFSVFLVQVKTNNKGYIDYHGFLKEDLQDGKVRQIYPTSQN